jgi:uncharacterized protein with FMN-binding domain
MAVLCAFASVIGSAFTGAMAFAVVAASGGYLWGQCATIQANDGQGIDGVDPEVTRIPASPLEAASQEPTALGPIASKEAVLTSLPEVTAHPLPQQNLRAASAENPYQSAATPARSKKVAENDPAIMPPVPMARPTFPQAARIKVASSAPKAPVQSQGKYRDGSYRGTSTDAYYGVVQVEPIVKMGTIASVKVLQHPSDRSTSRYINAHALPTLQREVIKMQTAGVNFVSGAT